MLLGLNGVILLVSSELGGDGYILHMLTSNLKTCTADDRQPWTIYVNSGNKYLIIGAVVSSEYSNI